MVRENNFLLDNTEALLKQISLGEDSVLEFKDIEYSSNSITGPNRNFMADDI